MRPTCCSTFFCIIMLFGSTPCTGLDESEKNFVEHCEHYKRYADGKWRLRYSKDVNCTTLYKIYDAKHYSSLWKTSGQSLPNDTTLLWSGTREAAKKASRSGTSWVTIYDTLPGYVAEKIGRERDAVWKGFSRQFAESASGVVQALLGNSTCIYNESSVFAKDEVPYLKGIPKLKVYIMNGTVPNCNYSCENKLLDIMRQHLSPQIEFNKTSKEYCEDDQKVVQAFVDGTLVISKGSNHVSGTWSFVAMSILVISTSFWARD